MKRLRILPMLVLAACLAPSRAAGQTLADSAILSARRAFDFLIGRWEVTSLTDTGGTTASRGESYEFTRALDGALIRGSWHFNRGTVARPDFVDAAYYQAFDNTARIWTFYYVSPQSAQYWPGRLEQGRWYFGKSFTDNGEQWQQRQWWEPVGQDTLRRHIENSRDGGRTWIPFVYTLRRVAAR